MLEALFGLVGAQAETRLRMEPLRNRQKDKGWSDPKKSESPSCKDLESIAVDIPLTFLWIQPLAAAIPMISGLEWLSPFVLPRVVRPFRASPTSLAQARMMTVRVPLVHVQS